MEGGGGGKGGCACEVMLLLVIGGKAMASQSRAIGKLAMAATPSSWVERFKDPRGFMARGACGEHDGG